MLPLAPPCSQYGFTGNFSLRQSNGYVVRFKSTGQVAGGQAFATGDSGDKLQGPVSGGVQGRDVDFTIRWNSGARGRYFGVVDNDGFAHGDTADEASNTSPSALWDSTVPLGCSTPATLPPPQQPPSPQPVPATADLGITANGPATLQAGLSGTYVVTVSNTGGVSAPGELFIVFAGKLLQTGQITAPGGFACEVRPPDAGINSAIRCTVQQLEPGAKYDVVVQGRGSAPGAGQLVATINPNHSVPENSFGNNSNTKGVTIT